MIYIKIKNNSYVSIVIPTKDRTNDLIRCLNSVMSQLLEGDEIILINGGNQEATDMVVRDLKGYGGQINIIEDKTSNFTYAINLGCRMAKNEIIGIVNDDIEFGEHWVESVKHWYNVIPNASSIGGVTKDMNPRKIQNIFETHKSLSKLYDKLVMGGQLYETGVITPSGSFSIGSVVPETPKKVSGFSGANMVIRKQILEEVGYFNTIFKYAGAEGYFYLELLDKKRRFFLFLDVK